jgi:hypothetical protein
MGKSYFRPEQILLFPIPGKTLGAQAKVEARKTGLPRALRPQSGGRTEQSAHAAQLRKIRWGFMNSIQFGVQIAVRR